MSGTKLEADDTARGGWLLRCIAGALLIAGIVHLATILVLAQNDETSAYAGVAALGQNLRLHTFAGPPAPARILPYRDPAMVDAFCLFDLREGAVEITLPVTPLDVATVSVHNRHGAAIYALTNRSAVHGVVSLAVVTRAMAAAAEGSDDGVLRVAMDDTEGFVMVQALAAMPSLRPAAESEARSLICRNAAKS